MLGGNLRWTSIPSRGSRNTPSSRFTLQKPEISTGTDGPCGLPNFFDWGKTLPFTYLVNVVTKPSPVLPRPCPTQNAAKAPSNQRIPCLIPTTSTKVPNNLPKTKGRVGPVDLVFLVDGSDIVNETLFRSLLDIVRNTYIRFPVSSDGTHVAFAVYGTNVRVVKNLKSYNVGTTDDALRSVSKPGGLSLAGKALAVVKNDIFNATGRPGQTGATRVLLHIMCGKSLDDVKEPAEKLREEGVRIVAAGACPGDNKMDLCNIGSAPRCNNSVIIQILRPPEIPAQELTNKLKEG